jgi:hypothetical protein
MNTAEPENEMAYLGFNRHLISHPSLGLRAQLGDRGDHLAHLGQGCLDPLVALGDSLPHGPLGRAIHHEQCLP